MIKKGNMALHTVAIVVVVAVVVVVVVVVFVHDVDVIEHQIKTGTGVWLITMLISRQ